MLTYNPLEVERVTRSFSVYGEAPSTQLQIIPVAIAETGRTRNPITTFQVTIHCECTLNVIITLAE